MKPQVAIVGGGVGGLALAVALSSRGWSVRVYERAPAITAVGAGLLLTPNATVVLRGLGVLDRLVAACHVNRTLRLGHKSGRVLASVRVDRWPTPALSTTRAMLQTLLLGELPPGCVRTGSELTDCQQSDEGWQLRFADGSTATADVVIGADGLHSRVRTVLFDRSPPVYRGYVGWRGLAEMDLPEFDGTATEFWGQGARFGIAPSGRGVTYWYATSNHRAGWNMEGPQRREYLRSIFAGWHPAARALSAATPADSILLSPMQDRPVLRRWHRGTAVLLGDAAHPMTPNLGQGACAALEDAAILARELEQDARDPAAAVARFVQRRRRRVQALVLASRWLGRIIQHESSWGCALRDRLLRLSPDAAAQASFDRIFAFGNGQTG